VTVCIAAIATGLYKVNDRDEEIPVIIGVSDRMITAVDFEYERPQSKISRITPYIVALTAGDDAIQATVLNRTESHFNKEMAGDPRFFPVEEIADIYSKNLVAHLKQTIERTILEPVGLNWKSYLSSYPDKAPIWFEERKKKVWGDIDPPITKTIIAGVDEDGAHIFVIDGEGSITCQDRAGFAAVGIGEWHAESQFMFEKHSPSKPYPDTLFLTYVAKRRAEVAPGVGKDTDLCVISLKGGYVELSEELVAFNKVYENIIRKGEKESAKLKIAIIDTMEKTQEARKAKYEEIWQEKMKKWAISGKLGDSPVKMTGKVTVTYPNKTD